MVPAAEQRKVFKRPPVGVRKIVLATNIAESVGLLFALKCRPCCVDDFCQPQIVCADTIKKNSCGAIQNVLCNHSYPCGRLDEVSVLCRR